MQSMLSVLQSKELRGGSVDAEEEVAHGLQQYFDKSLLALLLYSEERQQVGFGMSWAGLGWVGTPRACREDRAHSPAASAPIHRSHPSSGPRH